MTEANTLPDKLQVAKLPIVSNDDCRSMFSSAGYKKTIKPTVICAGLAAGGKDSCEGDSGGPLTVFDQDRRAWVLVGIVSNGIRCGEPNLPGIYTRLSKYLQWINSVVSGWQYVGNAEESEEDKL